MSNTLPALVLTLAVGAAWPHPARAADAPERNGDPLQSAECRQALEVLQARHDEARAALPASAPTRSAAQRTPHARLVAAQRQAARACLRSRADPPTAPRRFAPPAPLVPRIAAVPAPSAPAARLPPPPAVTPAPAEPPRFITSCDPAGCWASDGSRLPRVGPALQGPNALPCTVHGGLLLCP